MDIPNAGYYIRRAVTENDLASHAQIDGMGRMMKIVSPGEEE
jgi:hypothetical protein